MSLLTSPALKFAPPTIHHPPPTTHSLDMHVSSTLREAVASKRDALMATFLMEDPRRSGLVSTTVWAEVMQDVLGLVMDWKMVMVKVTGARARARARAGGRAKAGARARARGRGRSSTSTTTVRVDHGLGDD